MRNRVCDYLGKRFPSIGVSKFRGPERNVLEMCENVECSMVY